MMKKTYTSPTVEKIRFNYRDQVVAASGSAEQNETNVSSSQGYGGTACNIYDFIVKVVETPGDWRVCNIYA